jgi:hypothetical protein
MAILKVPWVSHPFQVQVANLDEYGVELAKFVPDAVVRDYMSRTFYAEHPEYLDADTVRTAPPVKLNAEKREPPRDTDNPIAFGVAHSSEFERLYVRAVMSCKPHYIAPVVDLLWSTYARYAENGDDVVENALDLFTEASRIHNKGLKPSSFWAFYDALEEELRKKALSFQPRSRFSSG